MKKFEIRLYDPTIGNREKSYVLDCIKTNWISSRGKYIEKFERKFSKFIKIKHSISVVNGTAALHLALLSLNIKQGDEVIVPSFTYIAPVNAIKYVGAKVKFIDSNLATWQLDETKLEKMITRKTKAVIAPHLLGQSCRIAEIKNICRKKKIFLIEDCAEAFGNFYKGKHLGTFGDVSTFSFFGSKTITTGEGGMVVTNNTKIAQKVYKLKTVGVTKKRNYWHDVIGYNYRMTNICAAIGLAQINNAKKIIKNKIRVYNNYKKFLPKNIFNANYEPKNFKSAFWLINIFLKNKSQRDKLSIFLRKKGIETRTTFIPIHLMPMYFRKNHNLNLLKNAQKLSDTGLILPSGSSLSLKKIKKISAAINNFLQI